MYTPLQRGDALESELKHEPNISRTAPGQRLCLAVQCGKAAAEHIGRFLRKDPQRHEQIQSFRQLNARGWHSSSMVSIIRTIVRS